MKVIIRVKVFWTSDTSLHFISSLSVTKTKCIRLRGTDGIVPFSNVISSLIQPFILSNKSQLKVMQVSPSSSTIESI